MLRIKVLKKVNLLKKVLKKGSLPKKATQKTAQKSKFI